ncbi:SRPBCC family protein [Kribbella sp. NPDC051587]|uniref:SRPBCC family protein n=1 Tax=Kribbella sp. NPDC051587 TaxID=3364119 RepID=UPI0037B8E8DE
MAGTTSSKGTAVVSLPADDQILITREFNAPKHLVYRAWTTPELVAQFWSGHRGSMRSVEIDLRVGGRWRYVMAAGHGEMAFHGEFLEIVPNERIVNTEMFETPDAPGSDADAPVTTTTFSERDGRTTLTLLMQCGTKELRDTIIQSGMEIGMQEQMNLLEELAISLMG